MLRRFGQCADQFARCFNRQAQRDGASQSLDALFNDSERKSMQAKHGRLSDPGSYEALQHFITDSPWAAEPVWTRLRALVPVRRGMLALDDTSFPKQGTHSVGVKRQYCGALGKIANCQVAVSTILLADQLASRSSGICRRSGTRTPRGGRRPGFPIRSTFARSGEWPWRISAAS
ncbi:MAG: transposase [Acidobacteria bacterium]|nr:transposase [Acidobacteriota bacterium]